MISNIVGSFIMVLIGITIISPLNQAIYPLGWIIGTLTIIGGATMFYFTAKNLFTGTYVEEESTEEEPKVEIKKHKQTYLEYVKERLAVEHLMKEN